MKNDHRLFQRIEQKAKDRIRILIITLLKQLGFPELPKNQKVGPSIQIDEDFRAFLGYGENDEIDIKAIWNLGNEDHAEFHQQITGLSGSSFSIYTYLVYRFRLCVSAEVGSQEEQIVKEFLQLRTGLNIRAFITQINYSFSLYLFSVILKLYLGNGTYKGDDLSKWIIRFAKRYKPLFQNSKNLQGELKIIIPKQLQSKWEKMSGTIIPNDDEMKKKMIEDLLILDI